MPAKFKLTAEFKEWLGVKLFRIEALIDIKSAGVRAGDKGGYVEKENNLDQDGNAWVFGNAWVYGDALVYGNARVSKVICAATRSDNYTFVVVATPQGSRIIAGCRYFTFAEARAHWSKTRVGTQLGDESLALVDHLERMATILGLNEPVKAEE